MWPVVGDWNGNGTQTIGLYDHSTGTFYLRNSNSPGSADHTFRFGPRGHMVYPLAGDWNGDGMETVGLYHPENGTFYLRNSHTPGGADVTVRFGPGNFADGLLPLVGRW